MYGIFFVIRFLYTLVCDDDTRLPFYSFLSNYCIKKRDHSNKILSSKCLNLPQPIARHHYASQLLHMFSH